MIGWVIGLMNWKGRQNRFVLWAVILVSVLLNGQPLLLAARHAPLITFSPVCSGGLHRANVSGIYYFLDGKMKPEFIDAVEKYFFDARIRYHRVNDTLLVTFSDWLDAKTWEEAGALRIASWKTVYGIVKERTGIHIFDAPRILYVHPEDSQSTGQHCKTMKLIAMIPEGMEYFRLEDDPFWKERLKNLKDVKAPD